MRAVLVPLSVFFAMLLDISAGAFTVLVAGMAVGYEVSIIECGIGSLFALSPDIDCAWQFLRGRHARNDHHQYITHRPIFGVSVALLLGGAYGVATGMWLWCAVAPLLVLWHYLHDTEGFLGRGIAWLWPISPWHYGFCFSKMRITKRGPWEYGDDEHGIAGEMHDLYDLYFYPTHQSIVELVLSAAFWTWTAVALWGAWGISVPIGLALFAAAFWLFAAYARKRRKRYQKAVHACSCLECVK